MAHINRRRIDPEDAMCIDYRPSYPLPEPRHVSTREELIAADVKELAFLETRIAEGFGGQPFIDAAHCLRLRIEAL